MYFLTRFTQMELLQGARDEKEWLRLSDYLADQDYLEMDDEGWTDADRLYFDLRRRGPSSAALSTAASPKSRFATR